MTYKRRHICFKENIQVEDWQIKVYTISEDPEYDFTDILNKANPELPKWLEMQNSFDSSFEKYGFLILHAGQEGMFCIINWWVGENMLNSHAFIEDPSAINGFKKVSGDGLFACIWELDIINFERLAWLENILRKSPPHYEGYMKLHQKYSLM